MDAFKKQFGEEEPEARQKRQKQLVGKPVNYILDSCLYNENVCNRS